mgnify:CR=1 FL=1
MLITVEGTIEEIIFSNEANGYAVCEITNEKSVITLVGYMPFINEGEILKAKGSWINHPEYGEQLKVESFEKVMPNTVEAIEKYLGTGVIKGIGKATAKKIIKKFGAESLNVILENPEKLSDIKGMSYTRALEIGQALAKQRNFTDIVSFLQEHGISSVYAAKVYKVFGENTLEAIQNNPYRLIDEIPVISFKTVDAIAKSLGIDPESRLRICSGIKYVLIKASVNGHTYLPYSEVIKLGESLLGVDAENVRDTLIFMRFDEVIHIERYDSVNENNENSNNMNNSSNMNNMNNSNNMNNINNNFSSDDINSSINCNNEKLTDRVYLRDLYNAEISVTRRLITLANSVVLSNVRSKIDNTIKKSIEKTMIVLQEEEKIVLAETQKTAIREAINNGVMVITGGPGTGKTTIIKSIIKIFEKNNYKVALAAPTGRAAKRMTEATGYEAKTIHRLLEIGFVGDELEMSFVKTDVNPIDADVIIIDEMSMVDLLLMDSLLKAIKQGSRLILVGDVDQLPSVGPGNVLKDIIASTIIKTVRLTEVFRQAEKSLIVVNAHRINRGDKPILNERSKDFFFIGRNNPNDIISLIMDLCSKRIPAQYGYDPFRDIQILTPTRKGLVGVGNLNIELQRKLNPKSKIRKEKSFPNFTFREGDKVMQIKNNYNIKWEKVSLDEDGNRVKKSIDDTSYDDAYNASHDNACAGRYEDENDKDGEGVFNGDSGIINQIDHEEEKIRVLFDDNRIVDYYFDAFDEIDPAYAITIHKSQGSEFPVVILPIFPGPPVLMTRNLLYTAITRARDLVIVVGLESTLYHMVDNDKETLRYSGLANKIRLAHDLSQ